MNFSCRHKKLSEHECSGMTSLETLLASAMLSVFTGVVAIVMQFTLRFFGEAESGELNEFETSNGVLIFYNCACQSCVIRLMVHARNLMLL